MNFMSDAFLRYEIKTRTPYNSARHKECDSMTSYPLGYNLSGMESERSLGAVVIWPRSSHRNRQSRKELSRVASQSFKKERRKHELSSTERKMVCHPSSHQRTGELQEQTQHDPLYIVAGSVHLSTQVLKGIVLISLAHTESTSS
jgi:hypothetical protein